MDTQGAPVVFGERKGKSDKTLLIYNHYDVQPPEPLDLWVTPPFEPSLRDGKLYGRGVSDDKGHIISRCLPSTRSSPAMASFPATSNLLSKGKMRPPQSTSINSSSITRSFSRPMPACGNSAAWIIPILPCNILDCVAFATLNFQLTFYPRMYIPD